MAINLQKEFDKKTFIGIAIGVAALAGSYLAQNFVPESLDTKKKLRPIVVPIIVAVLSALLIKQKEYKPFAILGSAIMLIFGILKGLDEESSEDKKILKKIFGVSLAGDRQELEFSNISELKGFVDAATQVDGDGYYEISSPTTSTQINGNDEFQGEEVLYGEDEIHGEEVLYGDEIHGEEEIHGESVLV
ncbi:MULTISPECIES: hypothetical protein [Leptospira]|uniref:Uncharacterized protein n=1 Tax=Leptospira kirschneri str. H1 TaxID=1049966 RepID=A0A0E2B516_9LEPT|nr:MULTISPECIES: hypothetical protein [Leptospira]EKO16391.1 hypothetical protein LEP1GSC081_1342 [Leptospira kirschneri str. H1]EKO59686.1 hypothetical protein LEP1GSC082_3944 [Leptospira kirschneri str. H2]ULG86589.1 hypothetical protein FH594_21175 [Leptospira interrogans]UML78780.1 hypothetical protein FH602_01860 [Leptospira kirschneri]